MSVSKLDIVVQDDNHKLITFEDCRKRKCNLPNLEEYDWQDYVITVDREMGIVILDGRSNCPEVFDLILYKELHSRL